MTGYTYSPGAHDAHRLNQTIYAERDPMISRGDLFSACLDPVVGSEQGGIRPVLVIQNDVGNRYSPTVIVLAITGQVNKARLPTHVPVNAEGTGLQKDSVILAEQIRTLDKRRLRERIGTLRPEVMDKVSQALKISLGV
jgi:mRNA interferase MazF